MTAGNFIAYYRVSTARQGSSGLGLEAQRESVRSYLNGGNWRLVAEITEIESGKRADRPMLAEALRLCRLHNATLVIAKLDRLARNVAFISNLMESGVEFVATDFPNCNRLTVHILASVAEWEAKAISERTKAALAAAKARGVRLGGDPEKFRLVSHRGNPASAKARTEKARKRSADILPTIRKLQEGGMTLRGIARELTTRRIPAPRGGSEWQAVQVQRVLRHAP